MRLPYMLLLACSGCVVIVDGALPKASDRSPGADGGSTDAQASLDGDVAHMPGLPDGGFWDASGRADAGHPSDAAAASDGSSHDATSDPTGDDAGPTQSNPDGTRAELRGCGGERHACVLDAAGFLQCFGGNGYQQADEPNGVFTSVACGAEHTCAVREGGDVECWGSNAAGQRTVPVAVTARRSRQVAAGDRHSCALDQDGSVRCWGDDTFGQATPPAEHFSSIDAGDGFTCGLRDSDGIAVCWGNSATNRSKAPIDTPFTDLFLGRNYGCGVRPDRFLQCWGSADFHTSESYRVDRVVTGDHIACVLDGDRTSCFGGQAGTYAAYEEGRWLNLLGGRGVVCFVPAEGRMTCYEAAGTGEFEATDVALPD